MTSLLQAPNRSHNELSTSLSGILPAPKNVENLKQRALTATERVNAIVEKTALTVKKPIPSYGHRQNYIPSHLEDFGDGGAFPEIHIPQFPLGMGQKQHSSLAGAGTLALTLDAKDGGRLKYEIIAHQGHTKDRIIYARPEDARGRSIAENETFARPSEEEIADITEKTRSAIEKIVNIRVASCKPKQVQGQSQRDDTYIRYVSREAQENAEKSASLVPKGEKAARDTSVSIANGERIIRMVEAKIDPLEPAKFKHKKVAPLGGSPPAPVLHSPPRKATVEEQKAWYVPPSISNWKNPKGYTIPLDKRIASDGRGLQERVINEKFATFAESLYIAENYAREEIAARNTLEKKILEKERREKEEQLRQLAERARQSRFTRDGAADEDYKFAGGEASSVVSRKTGVTGATTSIHHHFDSFEEREKIRRERALEREREYRLSHMGTERRHAHENRIRERDVTEKVALGLNVSAPKDTAAQFDLRLFHKGGASAGLSSGFHGGEDDMYTVYDKPLFQAANAAQLLYHRPQKRDWDDIDGNEEEATGDEVKQERHRATLGRVRTFVGAESGQEGHQPAPSSTSSGPIQFEKLETSTVSSTANVAKEAAKTEERDIFGLEQFLEEAKRGRK